MLDIRAIHCPSPLPEVDFASVTLTVRLKNYADEPGEVTGTFRVYNDTTGLLIHTSGIAPVTIAAGVTVDVDALTDFDPPAPADDVYFVLFDGTARNELVPDGIGIHRGVFYFDVKAIGMGPAPAAHHATHEDGGSDEVDCTGLAGTGASAHAASHEKAGADELEVADLATAELDDTLVLSPDGGGGVEFRAPAAAGASPATFELFTADGTWTKPVGAKLVYVECVGAGGGGGGGRGGVGTQLRLGGSGGGAGALARRFFPADGLAATVDITVPAGGTGGGNQADGVAGTTSKFGAVQGTGLWAFGGGYGCGNATNNLSGGAGGGTASVGGNGSASSAPGGFPGAGSATAIGGQGAASVVIGAGGNAEYGGGAGGGTQNSGNWTFIGGSSLYGPAGGGAGGACLTDDSEVAGSAGGAHGSYVAGGGGAGGAVNGGAGGNGATGNGYSTCGAGGGGGGGQDSGTGGAGGTGGAPGGGGGGSGGGTSSGGTGGTGGRGEVRVWVWF